MKKLNLFLAALIAAFMSVTFMSCNKENELKPFETTEDQIVLQKILDFKNSVENPDMLKSEQTLSIDSAVWYIEAALNYTYCQRSENNMSSDANEQIIDSIFIDYNATENTIKFQIINELYSSFENELLNKFNALNYATKLYNFVDIEYLDNSFKMVYEIRFNDVNLKAFSYYTITSDWNWGLGLGKCDGTYYSKDATNEIVKWVMQRIGVIGGVYYTDIHYTGTFVSTNLSNLGYIDLGPLGIYMYFFITTDYLTDFHKCLTSSTCTLRASETLDALNYIEQNYIETTEDITSWQLESDYYYKYAGLNFEKTYLYHLLTVYSGTRHTTLPQN